MNTWQKLFVSAAAIFSFSFYAYYLRTQDNQIVAAAPITDVVNNSQTSGNNSASPADFQAYLNQINSAAAKRPPPTRTAVSGGEGEAESDEGEEGRRVSTRTPTPSTQPAQNTQTAQQKTVVQTQAQQLAAQQAVEQQAAAQAQAQQLATQQAAQEQAAAQAQAQKLAAEQAAAQAQATQQTGQYKNGTYTGSSVNVFYGYVQVEAVVQNGQLADVRFLQYPNDRSTSRYINSQAMPLLKQEAIQAQSGNVDGVSGASATSQGFVQSLTDALSQARA